MKKLHTKMWQKIVLAVVIATVSALAVVYITYFRKPPVDEILNNNRKIFGRMSRKALEQNGGSQNGIPENIDIQIAQYQAEKWERWLQIMGFVSVGELYDKCEGEDKIILGQVILLPDKENGGIKAKIYSNFTLHEKIEDGEIHMQVKYNDVKIFQNHWPLCEAEDEMEDKVLYCPLQPGRKRFVKNMKVPNYLPKGKYTTRAWVNTPDKKMMGCAICEFVL